MPGLLAFGLTALGLTALGLTVQGSMALGLTVLGLTVLGRAEREAGARVRWPPPTRPSGRSPKPLRRGG
ncbi:hypothetical protein GCM10012289_13100 [Nonomuraea cavernae]|uniref:Uncharacterized protein n=1 Tax=Nonomuraea cavernae TaxID=2045107 RepID=A0A917YRV0_9ACTN|nr:hypothetical protein GCM10012289_13100 [Nonomuraea cavernae]